MRLDDVPQQAYESKLLDRERHERLILNIEAVAKKSGVPASVLWSRLSDVCETDSAEYLWVRDLRISIDGGLLYLGPQHIQVLDKMRGIVGVCLRNYTDARVMSLQSVIKALQAKGEEMYQPTVLLIPNFCLESDTGMKDWQVHELLGLLIERATDGKKTILYADSWTAIEKMYGPAVKEHLESYYAVCAADGFHSASTAAS